MGDLLIDIGNTRIKWATLSAGQLVRGGSAVHRDSLDAAAAAFAAELPARPRIIAANVAGNRMYQGIFDTDFDKYIEDAVALFASTGITTVFTNLEGFPENWQNNVPAINKFFREHQCPSFLEYAEYPYATADEVKKALRVKSAMSNMLDQMQ